LLGQAQFQAADFPEYPVGFQVAAHETTQEGGELDQDDGGHSPLDGGHQLAGRKDDPKGVDGAEKEQDLADEHCPHHPAQAAAEDPEGLLNPARLLVPAPLTTLQGSLAVAARS